MNLYLYIYIYAYIWQLFKNINVEIIRNIRASENVNYKIIKYKYGQLLNILIYLYIYQEYIHSVHFVVIINVANKISSFIY